MRLLKNLLIFILSLTSFVTFSQTTTTISTSGTWTVPAGVTSIIVECWGGGGGGGGAKSATSGSKYAAAGGGGGGAYSKSTLTVTAGNSFTVTIGAGGNGGASTGANGTAGGTTTFTGTPGTVSAAGGGFGTGAVSTSTANSFTAGGSGGSTGTGFLYAGGNGAAGYTTYYSGAGGGGAGSGGAGGNATTYSTGGAGGTGTTAGGTGGIGNYVYGAGSAGAVPGGGGGGGVSSNGISFNAYAGAAGGAGQVKVTYTVCTAPAITAQPSNAGGSTCQNGTAFTALSVTATGTTLSYQWQSATAAAGPYTSISGATSSTYTPPNTATGTVYYNCYISNTCGNVTTTASGAYVVNVIPSAVTVATAGTYCGPTTLTASGGSGGTIYWQNTTTGGTSTATASSSQSVSTSGTYYFRSYGGGCWGSQGSAAITINTPISITGQPSVSNQSTCQSGTAFTALSVTATGTTPTYQWYSNASASNTGGTLISGATTATYTPPNSTAGVLYYYCVVSGATSCSSVTSSVSGSFTVNSIPTAVTVSTTGTYCTSTTLTATGGTGGTIYWQNTTTNGTSTATPSNSQSISASGTYYFRAQNAGGCWGSQGSATITINTPISITVQPSTASQTKCSGSAFTSISVTVTGTSPSYQWQQSTDGSTGWTNAVGGTGATTATYTPPNTTTGVLYYQCVVTSPAPCSSSVTSGVSGAFTVNANPTVSYTGSPFTYTVGTAISTLTPTTSNSPSTFTISPTIPSGLSMDGSTGVITGTPSATSASTAYTITGTTSNGCTATANITIAIGPSNALCSTATTLTCGSSSGTTVGTTGVASGIPTAATYLSTGLSNYGVWYKVVGDGSSYSITFTPSASYDPEVDVVSGSCGTYTAVTAVDAGSSGGAETVTFATTAGTNYYIYIAHYASGNTTTGTFTISTTITPARPTGITGPNVICSNSTGVYSVTNVSGMTYNWTLPSGWTGTSTSNSITVTPGTSPGMIYVSATNSCGGTSSTANISASVNTYPQSVNAGNDVSICSGGSQSLSASATTGSVTLYNNDCNRGTNWVSNDVNRWGFSATANAGGVANELDFYFYSSVAGIDAYIRNATLIDATNFTGTTLTFRHALDWYSGTFNLYLETSPDNATWTSRWNIAPTADISLPGGAPVSVNLSALDGTSFYIRFRFVGNTTNINDWFIDNIAVTANATLSYSWINTTTGLSATNVSNPTASPTTTTTYTVQANAGGCTNTDQVLVTVNTPSVAPTSLSSSSTTICSGSSTTLTQSGGSLGTGAVWQWYTGANFTTPVGSTLSSSNASLSVSPTTTTTYYLRAINGTSPCSASIPSTTPSTVSVTVTIGGLVTGTHNTTALTVCDGYNPAALTITTPTTGVSPYTYQWKINGSNATTGTGATTTTYDDTAVSPGVYSYTCVTTDACGSSVTSSPKTITVVADPSSTNPTSTSLCLGSSGSALSVTGSGGTPSLSYQWYSNTTNSNTGGTIITGETNNTYTPPFTTLGTTYYYCVLSATGSACNNYNSNTASVVINGPSATSINSSTGSTLNNGDYVWNGSSNTTWVTAANWYTYNGSTFDVATVDPISTSTTIIVPNTVTQCISGSNQPTLSSTDNITNLKVVSGATLTLSNTLSITGDVKIDGTITGTGTAKLNGTGNQTLSGSNLTLPNLEVNKSSGDVTVSSPLTINGTLTMTSGDINNGLNLVQVGTSTSNLGSINWTSGSITGPIKRWFGNTTNSSQASSIFPVGTSTYDRWAQINFTSSPTSGGSITAQYQTGLPSLLYNGLPLNASGQAVDDYDNSGWWEITPDSYTGSLSQANYTITLRGNNLTSVTDITKTRIIKSPGPGHTTWSACGTHGLANGTLTDFTINSTSTVGFSYFQIAYPSNTALPVEMLSFSGDCQDDGTVINWETASEHNSAYFTIEKSRDGINWTTIETTGAAGNSTQLISYSYFDKGALGINYYRLNQVDFNGVINHYGPISINCESPGYFSTFPNPSGLSFNILINDDRFLGSSTVKVVDEMGKTVYEKETQIKTGINLIPIDNIEFKPGVYFITISNDLFKTDVIKQSIK